MKLPKRDMPNGNGSGGGDKYLKLKDGESVNGVFRGEIFEFKMKWVAGKGVNVPDTDPEGKSRFKLNFITVRDKVLTALIFEFGLVVYGQLAAVNEEYALEKTKVKITRHGSGTDTTYVVMPLLNAQDRLNAAMIQKVESIPLNLLDHGKGRSNGVQETPPAPEWGDPMPDASDQYQASDESDPGYPQF